MGKSVLRKRTEALPGPLVLIAYPQSWGHPLLPFTGLQAFLRDPQPRRPGGSREQRRRSPWQMLGLTRLRSPPLSSSLEPCHPRLVAVCVLWQGNPRERGAGEKTAFSPSPLWPPKVLPAGVHL